VQTYGTGAVSAVSDNKLVGIGNWTGLVNGVNSNLISIKPNRLNMGDLTNNGVPTPTLALPLGNPAIVVGTSGDGVVRDQRGVARDSYPDIRATEYVYPLDHSCVEPTQHSIHLRSELSLGLFGHRKQSIYPARDV
jgi:hypothetical protein